jgi:hypothetical protein
MRAALYFVQRIVDAKVAIDSEVTLPDRSPSLRGNDMTTYITEISIGRWYLAFRGNVAAEGGKRPDKLCGSRGTKLIQGQPWYSNRSLAPFSLLTAISDFCFADCWVNLVSGVRTVVCHSAMEMESQDKKRGRGAEKRDRLGKGESGNLRKNTNTTGDKKGR